MTGTRTGNRVPEEDYKKKKKSPQRLKRKGTISLTLAHQRLGDTADDTLLKMSKNGTAGLSIEGTSTPGQGCPVCVEANLKRQDTPKMGVRQISRPCQTIGSDLQAIDTQSFDGKNHFAIYADYYSGCALTEPLTRKRDQLVTMEYNLTRFERLSGHHIDTWRCDQGGEFLNKKADEMCLRKHIHREFSDTGEAHQNGLAERIGGQLLAMMRAAHARSKVPKKYWTESLRYQTWVRNRVSMRRQNGKTTPMRVLTMDDTSDDLSRARTFGCEAWVLRRKEKKEKLDSRAVRGVCMGVSMHKKAWRILLWDEKVIIESRNAVFFEDIYPYKNQNTQESKEDIAQDLHAYEESTENESLSDNEEEAPAMIEETTNRARVVRFMEAPIIIEETVTNKTSEQRQEGNGGTQPLRRSGRVRKPPDRYTDDQESQAKGRKNKEGQESQENQAKEVGQESHDQVKERNTQEDHDSPEPASLEAFTISLDQELQDLEDKNSTLIQNADKALKEGGHVMTTELDPRTEEEANQDSRWLKAEKEEMRNLTRNKTWEVVKRPWDKQVLPTKMVYKHKTDEKGNLTRRKARFVVRGCFDKDKKLRDTYAPTLKYATLRILFAVSALLGVLIHQCDITAAFLYGILPEPVYVEQPRNFVVKNAKNFVLKLKKSLYGLNISPRLWNERFDDELKKQGFSRCEADPCLYVRHHTRGDGVDEKNHLTLLGVFVDDIFICGTDDQMVNKVKRNLALVFEITDLGFASWALGMKVTQEKDLISIDQQQYLKNVIETYGEHIASKTRNPPTPLPAGQELFQSMSPTEEKEKKAMDKLPYRNLLGALMYLAVGSRPDIAQATSLLARFSNNPGQDHWEALLHLLRYLRGKPNVGLTYEKKEKAISFNMNHLQGQHLLQAYVDANYATDKETSKSVSGQVFTMAGGAVSWKSKKQSVVATSTCHAEYIAAAEMAREAVWIRSLLEEIGFTGLPPMRAYEDNEAARFLAHHPAVTERSKHIRVRYHYVRECVREKVLELVNIPSKENAADSFTKAVNERTLKMSARAIGLRRVSSERLTLYPNGSRTPGGC